MTYYHDDKGPPPLLLSPSSSPTFRDKMIQAKNQLLESRRYVARLRKRSCDELSLLSSDGDSLPGDRDRARSSDTVQKKTTENKRLFAIEHHLEFAKTIVVVIVIKELIAGQSANFEVGMYFHFLHSAVAN
eukprot:sb/3475052/